MRPTLSFWNLKVSTRRALAACLVAGGALAMASCENETVPAPDSGAGYYPVAVGNYWIYAVADTTWSQASQSMPSVATPKAYQFKETITEEFTDAAGKKAFRLVRSKREGTSGSFVNDSVFTLSATGQSVTLNRNSTRTLELIFPVRDGRLWNFNAYNNNFNDTITAETRRYSRAGESFTTRAVAGNPAQTFANTVTTSNTGAAAETSLLKRIGYQQVFAKGIGPVYRRRDLFLNYNYADPRTGDQIYVPGSYFYAFSRRETLIDYGPR